MLFHRLDYLFFLGLALVGAWGLRRLPLTRVAFLCLASCAFYAAWSFNYLALIAFSILADYLVGLGLGRAQRLWMRRALLAVSLATNLGLLFTFKYADFVATAWVDLQRLGGGEVKPASLLGFLLPVGISFYTFQTLSYSIDVYRRRIPVERNLLHFALFVTFFPQLVAGPIVRASEFLPQLTQPPKLARRDVGEGLMRIAVGLTKKIVFADYLSLNLVDRAFDNPEAYTATEMVLALYGFTVQMYCDFSGYTDVARGSAQLLGFKLPQNFDRPYQATNPADFWRRWHMTLSTWLRDYLYFPLGGSRVGPMRAYVNLWLTLFLIGVWHGASWNFVLYGALQAFAMVLHRVWHRWRVRRNEARPAKARSALTRHTIHVLSVVACMQFVVFSRILFRATSLENARQVFLQLGAGSYSVAQLALPVWAALIFGLGLHYTPRHWYGTLKTRFAAAPGWAQAVLLLGLGALLAQVATSEVVPYIYFQF